MASFDKFNLGTQPAAPEPPAAAPEGAAATVADEPKRGKLAGLGLGKARGKGGDKGAKRAVSGTERTYRRLTVACGVASAIAVAALGVGGTEIATAVSLRNEIEGSCEQLVTLTRSVKAGETISDGDLEVSSVPAAWAPADAATEKSQVAGKVAAVDLTEGNAVSQASLSGSQTASSLPAAVSAGNVGYMVSFSSTADAASPMLRPGDRVDIMAGGEGADARVVCSDVRVIAVDGSLDGSTASAGYSNVTFDLTYEQATELFASTQVSSQSIHLLVLPREAKADEGTASEEGSQQAEDQAAEQAGGDVAVAEGAE